MKTPTNVYLQVNVLKVRVYTFIMHCYISFMECDVSVNLYDQYYV